jgi:hypothetical protein
LQSPAAATAAEAASALPQSLSNSSQPENRVKVYAYGFTVGLTAFLGILYTRIGVSLVAAEGNA